MSQADYWYVRFPDGRILRAASTLLVRQELSAGHIPLSSTVRRAPSDEWVSLGWTQEFADLVEQLAARSPSPSRAAGTTPGAASPAAAAASRRAVAASIGSRLDPDRLHLIGVRGYLHELLVALDSTLIDKKMSIAVVAGLILGFLLALAQAGGFERDAPWIVPAWCLAGAAAIALDFLAALLIQLTYVELARLRPARWRDGLAGIGRLAIRLVLTQAIICGAVWGIIMLLRWAPYWLGGGAEEAGSEIAAGTVLALGMVLEAALWPIFALWWQVPPILVVEGTSIAGALRQWYALLRHHLGRVLLYQAMAVGLGLGMTLCFLLPIAPLFLPTFVAPEPLANVAAGTRCLLLGLACAPLWAYWTVANVFIYLNLRYGGERR